MAIVPGSVPELSPSHRTRLRRRAPWFARQVIQARKAGEAVPDLADRDAMVPWLAARMIADEPDLANDPALDWDAILAFIEKLLPLILALIQIFGGL